MAIATSPSYLRQIGHLGLFPSPFAEIEPYDNQQNRKQSIAKIVHLGLNLSPAVFRKRRAKPQSTG